MRKKKKSKNRLLILAILMYLVVAPFGTADAMRWKSGDNVLDCDVQMIYGIGVRAESQDSDLLRKAGANADDGNRNFEKWDMTACKFSLIADIEYTHNNFGFFIRPKAFYDYVYKSDNSNDSPLTNNEFQAGETSRSDKWSDDVEDVHGLDARILDAYAFATFPIPTGNLDIRVGRQVIAWGESSLIGGGVSSAQNPIDLSAATSVGAEIKEILLPSEAVYLQFDVTEALALKTYYQWKWRKSEWMEAGTFLSGIDLFDEAAHAMIIVPGVHNAVRTSDDDASDSGQWGVGLTYVADWFRKTEFGLYYLNYHDKFPQLDLRFGPVPALGGAILPISYNLVYPEDIKLYGASVSTGIGDLQIAAEITHRRDLPTGVTTTGEYTQAQVNWVYGGGGSGPGPLGNCRFFDSYIFLGEVAYGWENDTPDDNSASKISLIYSGDWLQVTNALDVSCMLSYDNTFNGPTPLGFDGATNGSIAFTGTYKDLYKFSLKYSARMGTDSGNGVKDRDDISFTATYTF